MICGYTPADRAELLALWQAESSRQGYAPRSDKEANALLFGHPYFAPEHTFLRREQGRITAFVLGCTGNDLPHGAERGYFTALIAQTEWDTDETAALLLAALEQSFREAGRRECAVTFFNPMHMPWVLPGTPGHEHNNMPGVAVDLPLHRRMLRNGYRETTRECAMYRTLADFEVSPEIRALAAQAAGEGYTVAQYDPERHSGLAKMLAALDNPDWTAQITAAAEKNLRLPVALCGNTVAGFAGPVYPEPTGRGYFAGIGIAPQYRRHHLGQLLFSTLCEAERAAGAEYMSLFTGRNNSARRIYEAAGFRTVREFGVMCKAL